MQEWMTHKSKLSKVSQLVSDADRISMQVVWFHLLPVNPHCRVAISCIQHLGKL